MSYVDHWFRVLGLLSRAWCKTAHYLSWQVICLRLFASAFFCLALDNWALNPLFIMFAGCCGAAGGSCSMLTDFSGLLDIVHRRLFYFLIVSSSVYSTFVIVFHVFCKREWTIGNWLHMRTDAAEKCAFWRHFVWCQISLPVRWFLELPCAIIISLSVRWKI